jgi:hypothetical protein
MMRVEDGHASSEATPIRYFDHNISASGNSLSSFSFPSRVEPNMQLQFTPRPTLRPLKRRRATGDIDGEHSCMQKKKRRLRLFLITSRLSPQYSHPATNIVDRGSSKIAVWAKQKSLGRNLLRKAAILNRIRRQAGRVRGAEATVGCILEEKEKEKEELALARLEFKHGSVDTYTRPVSSRTPSVPPTAAIRTSGRFVVSGSPTGSMASSTSPSPTSSTPPLGRGVMSFYGYCSPNEAYANSLPRAQLPRRDYLPLPPSPLGLSNYDAFDADDHYSRFDDDEEEEDEEPSTTLWAEDDEPDHVPFSPSAVTSSTSTAIHATVERVLQAPPSVHANFTNLDHDEAVLGDYDQVDEGADAVWPNTSTHEPSTTTISSTSPSFTALFATSTPKRTDSFATSPNFRPNLISTTASTSVSLNFAPSSSSPNFAPPPISPTFTAADPGPQHHRTRSLPSKHRPDDLAPDTSDVQQERKRQRDLMLMRFRS